MPGTDCGACETRKAEQAHKEGRCPPHCWYCALEKAALILPPEPPTEAASDPEETSSGA